MTTNQEKIILINRDSSLSQEEKMSKIRELINSNHEKHLINEKPICQHYKKSCSNFYFDCCNEYYDCCRCHNENNKCTDRKKVKTIKCDNCNLTQDPAQFCIECNSQFSRNYCNICKIWSEKNIFHCAGCQICRVGDRSQFFHCDDCNLCFNVRTQNDHKCSKKINDDSKCGYCLLNVFDSQNHLIILKCGHPVHKFCLSQSNDYRCPLCRKSLQDMTNYWSTIYINILQHPIPEELKKKVNIICYDCEKNSNNIDWHFMGMRCLECNGYNTSIKE